MSTSLGENLPEVLTRVRTRPLFVIRERVPPLIVVGETPNAFRRVGIVQGGAFAALIVMTYQAFRTGPLGVLEKLDKGEAVDPGTYYFRMIPIFETSAARYDWLNRIVAVGIGHRRADGPIYSLFEVL
jgi:hypothetical protein